MKPAVILVGADKGGVGKTTVSRALLDYLAANNILTRAFDTEHPRGTLKRFHGPVTEVVDIGQTSDQMRIIDTLNSAQIRVSVIDTRAGALGATLRALRDIGFLDAVKAGEFSFTLLHVLGPSIASLDEIAETAPFVDSANYFLVKNHINATTFFEWDPRHQPQILREGEPGRRNHCPQARRNGLRASGNRGRAVLDLRRQQDGQRRTRQRLLRAARLRAHLAGQDRGRTEPRALARPARATVM